MFDGTCSSLSYISTIGGSASIGSDVSGVEGAVEFDITVSESTIAPGSTPVVAYLSGLSACTGVTWLIGEAASVLNKSDNPCTQTFEFEVRPAHYQILKVSSDLASFTLGDVDSSALNGSTADLRPIALNSTAVYTKQ